MISSILRYQKDHPCRPPHWRWERARILKEYKRRAPRKVDGDDHWVLEALRLQVDLDTAKDEIDRYRAYERAGSLGIAYDLWDNADASGGCRTELEARLLACQKVEEIAHSIAVTPDTVRAYEAVFFNVNDRLTNVGYIIHNAIGSKLHGGMTDKDFPVLLKAFAYFSKSSEIVDALLTTFPSGRTPIKDPQAYLTSDARWSMTRKSALASRMMPLNAFTQSQILELTARFEEVASSADVNEQEAAFLANIRSALEEVPISMTKRKSSVKAVETRVDEQVLLAEGRPLSLLPPPDDFTFPPPKTSKADG